LPKTAVMHVSFSIFQCQVQMLLDHMKAFTFRTGENVLL